MEVKKHEWRKAEKSIYIPKNTPAIIDIPTFKYFLLRGQGNPNSDAFSKHIEALYSLSYGIRMSYKKDIVPANFFQYTVYPLEGVWDLTEKAKKEFDKGWSKDDLVYDLMIRQPSFVDMVLFEKIRDLVNKKKPRKYLNDVELVEITEGRCCQMLHMGSYDDEPESFDKMEKYCEEQKLKRASKKHREIYLTDPRKVVPEKLKTVLRFKVK